MLYLGDAKLKFTYRVTIDNTWKADDLSILKSFTNVTILHFDEGSRVGDLLESIRGNSSIASLDIDFGDAEPVPLDAVNDLPSLSALSISGTRVNTIALESIGDLRNITFLSLANTSVDDGIGEQLAKLSKLRILSLRNTAVTGRVLSQLPPELFDLNLTGTNIGDNDAHYFFRIKNLDTLVILNPRLGPEALESIRSHASIRSVLTETGNERE
jgi:hypothetical protein